MGAWVDYTLKWCCNLLEIPEKHTLLCRTFFADLVTVLIRNAYQFLSTTIANGVTPGVTWSKVAPTTGTQHEVRRINNFLTGVTLQAGTMYRPWNRLELEAQYNLTTASPSGTCLGRRPSTKLISPTHLRVSAEGWPSTTWLRGWKWRTATWTLVKIPQFRGPSNDATLRSKDDTIQLVQVLATVTNN